MKTWVNISDFLFFQEGPGVRNTQYTPEGVKLLNVANLIDGHVDLSTSERYISLEEAYGKYKHFLCDPGDLIIASSGIKVEYIDKKMGFIDETMLPLCMNTSTIRFKVLNPQRLRIRYFMYYLKSHHFKSQLAKQITGSAQLNYGPSHLKKMMFPLVDTSAQDEYIERLDATQKIISLYKQELLLLDDLIKARFVEMFGEPIDNPMKWQVKPLKEISTLITNGNTPKGGSENYVDDGIIFLRSQNVWRNRIDLSDVAYIDEMTHISMKKSSVHHNDILITKTGRINTDNSSLGRAALYTGEDDSANINGHVYLVRLKDGINPRFVVTILTGEAYRKYIRKVCVGGIDKRQINLDQVEDFPIIRPPIEEQIRFAEFAEQVDKSKDAVKKSLEETQILFDSLMQQYFG